MTAPHLANLKLVLAYPLAAPEEVIVAAELLTPFLKECLLPVPGITMVTISSDGQSVTVTFESTSFDKDTMITFIEIWLRRASRMKSFFPGYPRDSNDPIIDRERTEYV